MAAELVSPKHCQGALQRDKPGIVPLTCPFCEIVAGRGLAQVNDPAQLEKLVGRVLSAHPDQVAAYRGGKSPILDWLFGQEMKEAGGKANPARLREHLRRALDSVPAESSPRRP